MSYSTEIANKYIQEYAKLHKDKSFKEKGYAYGYGDGKSVANNLPMLKNLIEKYKVKSILDYGCGKAVGIINKKLLDHMNLDDVGLYDPAIPKWSKLPEKTYGGVICFDVMEHIPEQNVEYVIEEIKSKAEKFIFFAISCNPAKELLSNGENAHVTIKPPGWWSSRLKNERIQTYVKYSVGRQNILTNVNTGDIRYV